MSSPRTLCALLVLMGASAPATVALAQPTSIPAAPDTSYARLVRLFHDWRAFEAPKVVDDVPDYTRAAMAAQAAALRGWQARLDSIDTSAWPVSEKIDWWLVKAEMNGLDFDQRVRRPWARDPSFYVTIFPDESDVPTQAGPTIHGEIELWSYHLPLSASYAAELARRIGAIPRLLEQARGNLADGNARDLWSAGIPAFARQSADLAAFGRKVAGTSPRLDAAIAAARRASDGFRAWLEQRFPSKTGPSGVGKANYDWYLRNVHLSPYTWDQLMLVMHTELDRAWASLGMQELHDEGLPQLRKIDDAQEFDRRVKEAVDTLMAFLPKMETVYPWMKPAMEAVNPHFKPAPPGGMRGFFDEVTYRDPLPLRVHETHFIDLARMKERPNPSPIRRVPSLSNIYDGRAEGLATGMEEWTMDAGLFDSSPRTKEMIWIMLAERAARAVSGLEMHANRFTLDQAVAYASKWTPRRWLTPGAFARGEQILYLRQPGYGVSYISGKIQIEELMREERRRLGGAFSEKAFFDRFFASGVIPVAMIGWEMTGKRPGFLASLGK